MEAKYLIFFQVSPCCARSLQSEVIDGNLISNISHEILFKSRLLFGFNENKLRKNRQTLQIFVLRKQPKIHLLQFH